MFQQGLEIFPDLGRVIPFLTDRQEPRQDKQLEGGEVRFFGHRWFLIIWVPVADRTRPPPESYRAPLPACKRHPRPARGPPGIRAAASRRPCGGRGGRSMGPESGDIRQS